MNWTTAYVLVVVFVATSMHSGFGFGKALIAMPLLAFTLPVEVSTPLVVLLSTTVAFVMLLEDWHKVHFRMPSAWLCPASLAFRWVYGC